MMTVHEVSSLAGVSVRTLHHYDEVGLLEPSARSEAGYRLYNMEDLGRLQQIMLLRELGFSLKEIAHIIDSPGFDKDKAIEQQIELLEIKKERIEGLIQFARQVRSKGVDAMSFEAFDNSKAEEYAARAKEQWGHTDEWAEYERKSKGRGKAQEQVIAGELMAIFGEFAAIMECGPASSEAQALVHKLQAFITEHYYTCSADVLARLGKAYGAGGEFTANINASAGEGVAEFAAEAIAVYCA